MRLSPPGVGALVGMGRGLGRSSVQSNVFLSSFTPRPIPSVVKAASQGATRADRLRLPAGTFPAPSPRSVVAYVRHDPRWFIATRTEPAARPVMLWGEMGEKSSLASGRRRPCNLKRRLAGLRVVADREDRHPHGLPHSAWAMPAFIAKTRSSLSLIWPTCPPETPFGWQIAAGG